MSEKIKIADLAVGMYVVEVGDGSFDSPSTRVDMIMESEVEIEALKQSGALFASIKRSVSQKPLSQPSDADGFFESIGDTSEKMSQAVAYSRSMMEDARMGRAVDPEAATAVVDSMLQTIFKNESAALFLTKLGNYDDYTYMHCVNVAVLASVFGRHLGLEEADLQELGLSGLLHDLGKSLIPEHILNKPGKLTADEFTVMQSHPLKGYSLLRGVDGLSRNVLAGVLQHHEKWSGAGYPGGIRGEKIHEFARILAVVDVYDAMTSNRVYHKKRAETDVLGFLFKQKDSFAPSYVELFVKAVGIYPPGTLVRLSDGSLAVTCAVNPENSLMPIVSPVNETTMEISPKCVVLSMLGTTDEECKIVKVLDQGPGSLDMGKILGKAT